MTETPPETTPDSPPTFIPRFPRRLDNTILATHASCDHKVFRAHFQGLTPNAISPDLHAGGAFAKGMEVARKSLWIEKKPLKPALADATRAFLKYWGDYDPPDDWKGYAHPKSCGNTLLALWDYFREYAPGQDPIEPYMVGGNRPAVEFSFAIPMEVMHPDDGEPLLYCGRFDMLGKYGNFLCVIDEKTTKGIGVKWADQWNMRGQFIGYCYAAQLYGIKVNTALVRGIAIQKTQFTHAQAIISYEQWQIERWWRDANNKAQQMVDNWNQYQGYITATPVPVTVEEQELCLDLCFRHDYADACSAYGGCQFHKLCMSKTPSAWYGEYYERHWDPLAMNPTDERKHEFTGIAYDPTGVI